MHLNWFAKIQLRGGRGPWSSILFKNANRKRRTQKMLKETETEETIGFFATFLSLITF